MPESATTYAPQWPTQLGGMIRQPRKLPSNAVAVGLIFALGAAPAMVVSGMARPLDAMIASGMAFIAIAMAMSAPRRLPAVVIVYMVTNRFLRRLLDYAANEYSATPPTSLVCPALCLLMGFAVLARWKSLPKPLRLGAAFYGGAVAYGALVGVGWGAGMAFEALQWIGPFGFGLYVAWLRLTPAQLNRLVALFCVMTAVGMLYGWFQWLTLPPWDKFWVIHCGMGSIGQPEPLRCRFFGTFGAHGVAAGFASMSAALLLMTRCLPASPRIALALFLGLSALVTGVRSAWLAAIATLIVWLVIRRGGGLKVIVPLALAFAIGTVALPSLPGADFATSRLNTLGDLSNDKSLRGRVEFSLWAIKQVAARPYGFGLGSTGLAATRLNKGTLVSFDSGYLQPLYALGLPGSILLWFAMSYLAYPPMQKRFWRGAQSAEVGYQTRAILFGAMVLMLVENLLRTDVVCIFWMFVLAAHTAPHRQPTQNVPPRVIPAQTVAPYGG